MWFTGDHFITFWVSMDIYTSFHIILLFWILHVHSAYILLYYSSRFLNEWTGLEEMKTNYYMTTLIVDSVGVFCVQAGRCNDRIKALLLTPGTAGNKHASAQPWKRKKAMRNVSLDTDMLNNVTLMSM